MKRGGIIAAALMTLLGAGAAEAHLRDFIFSQDYYTAKRGEFEIELYNDMNLPEADNDDSYNSKHQIEFEYGVTNHFQLAYYEVYTWNRRDDWERDEFKLEAKLRLAEAGQWPVDVALYTEYKNPNGRRETSSDEVENKLILHKDVGPVSLVFNAICERAINAHSEWELEYTAGASYALTPRTRLGLEVRQGLGTTDEFLFDGSTTFLVMPTIATTITPHIRLLAGPAFGMTRSSNDVQLRSILEVEF